MSDKQEPWYGSMRLQYSTKSLYNYLITEEKLFTNRYDLYSFGLVYGILHNKKNEDRKEGFIPIAGLPKHVLAVLNISYLILNDGRDAKVIFQEMCEYADGGVIALNEIYKENKSFTIPDLIRDAEELWKERVKNLQNINLSK